VLSIFQGSGYKFRFLWLTALVIILDQVTKLIVKLTLPLYQSKEVFGDLLLLTHVQNTGAAFSISLGSPATNRIFFVIVTLIAICFVIYLIARSTSLLQRISLCLIIGGAVGNLIDRIAQGYVTDFLDADFPDFIMQRWPVFNVADSSIVIAMGLLILDMIINKEPLSDTHKPAPTEDNILP
jgi:signal peptidase II